MPNLKTETYGPGDQSWLGSTHGIGNAKTLTLDVSAFTKGTHYPEGSFKSGLPLGRLTSTGLAVPYNSAGADGSQNFVGFLLFDLRTDGVTDVPGAVLDHGRVRVSRLPIAFTVPAAATNKTTFVFDA